MANLWQYMKAKAAWPRRVEPVDPFAKAIEETGKQLAEEVGPRKINQAGLDLIKRFEGLRLKAYLCPAKVWTIGYGSTGKHVQEGMVITEARAEELLREDLWRFEKAVTATCPTSTDNQFAAMVSLAFNIGTAGFARSSVARHHNAGNFDKAAASFGMWNKATVGGRKVVLKGLTRRRAAERELYEKS